MARAHSAGVMTTLDLDPEWGAIDLIEEVEAAFGVKIADKDAERCWTVGDLYNLLTSLTPDWAGSGGSCGSSVVFYRMRRSSAAINKTDFTPHTPLVSPETPRAMFRVRTH